MAALPRVKRKRGPFGCREYSLIFVSSETAPCSRAVSRVLVRGAAWTRHFLAKESAGNAGSSRARQSGFHRKKPTPCASSVYRPTQGSPFRHLANFRFFFETREKTQLRTNSLRTGRATATRRRRQPAARLALHSAHSIFKRLRQPPPRLVPGRRESCVDRVPSASKKKL